MSRIRLGIQKGAGLRSEHGSLIPALRLQQRKIRLYKIAVGEDKKGSGFDKTDVAAARIPEEAFPDKFSHLDMRFLVKKAADRREFFRAGARYTVLGLLTVTGLFFGRRGQLNGQRCVNRGICAGCVVFKDCGLPAALSAKQARAGA